METGSTKAIRFSWTGLSATMVENGPGFFARLKVAGGAWRFFMAVIFSLVDTATNLPIPVSGKSPMIVQHG